MYKVPNLHVLRIKYLGPTNSRGSRVKIISDRFKQSLTIPFDYQYNNCEDIAGDFLSALQFNIVGIADGYVITDTFKALR